MKLAILQMADTPQIESTAVMLRSVGYEVMTCGPRLRHELIRSGCDTVLSVDSMVALGYDPLDPSIPEASLADVDRCDLFCEIKVRNVPRIIERWPRLKNRIIYWRVNGAQPEVCPKGGDEVNLPCPVVTACLWYGTDRYKSGRGDQVLSEHEHAANRPVQPVGVIHYNDGGGMGYVFWPPYPRSGEYDDIDRSKFSHYDAPYCLAHSAPAWGFGPIIGPVEQLGVKVYGNRTTNGTIPHSQVARITRTALALVHLKSVDCPGWALYEAMLSGCPVVTARLLNSRMIARDLLVDGVTCLEFGVPASLEYGRGDMAYDKCVTDISDALARLRAPEENRRIGEAGRRRLNELMWSKDKAEDVESFKGFLARHLS